MEAREGGVGAVADSIGATIGGKPVAQTQHLAMLMEGLTAWNQWREMHPEIRPDLVGAEARLSLGGQCSGMSI